MGKLEETIEIINEFIERMGYRKDPHVLGIFFYGSYLTGYANENSDIDLHVVFDNTNPNHLYRCSKMFRPAGKDKKIRFEFFEKPIGDLYLSIDKGFEEYDNAWLSILGTSLIVLDKSNGELEKLQKYALDTFSKDFLPLDKNKVEETVSTINNRMLKVRVAAHTDSPYFVHWYHITAEKILKFYHPYVNCPKLQTTKIPRIYNDEKYRKTMGKGKVPEQEFRDMYLDVITDTTYDKKAKFAKLEAFYEYAIKSVGLDKENHRIKIASRNSEYMAAQLLKRIQNEVIHEVQQANLKNRIIELVKMYKDREDVECIYLTLPSDSTDYNVTLTIVFNSLLIDFEELGFIRRINEEAGSETPQKEYGYNFRVALAYRYDYGVENTFVCRSNKFAELYNSKILYDKDGSYTEMSARKGKSWHIEKRPKAFDIDFGPDDFGSNQFDKK